MENFLLLYDAYHIIQLVVMTAIVVIYGMSAYYHALFVYKVVWIPYCIIKLWVAFASLLVSSIYIYLIIKCLVGDPIMTTSFMEQFARPVILLLGGGLTASSISRINSLRRGGERWIIRN